MTSNNTIDDYNNANMSEYDFQENPKKRRRIMKSNIKSNSNSNLNLNSSKIQSLSIHKQHQMEQILNKLDSIESRQTGNIFNVLNMTMNMNTNSNNIGNSNSGIGGSSTVSSTNDFDLNLTNDQSHGKTTSGRDIKNDVRNNNKSDIIMGNKASESGTLISGIKSDQNSAIQMTTNQTSIAQDKNSNDNANDSNNDNDDNDDDNDNDNT